MSLIYIFIAFYIIIFFIYKKDIIIKNKKYIVTFTLVFFSILLAISVIIYPENSVEAALNGVNIWINIIIPSLLPFFIISEILIGLGVVNFIGTLLKPVMEPIFNVPGEGAFPLAMSIVSGYPVGVKLVVNLRIKNIISKVEAQRLVSFCSTSGPLFMIGAVSVGMLKNPALGPLIAIPHYLGAITVGVLFKFYKNNQNRIKKNNFKLNVFKEALVELIKSRESDGRSLGNLMGDAVRESFNVILTVGGFIIIYSVIIEILTVSHMFDYVSKLLSSITNFNNSEIIKGILSGAIEMTNGCKIISDIESTNLLIKMVSISFLIGWSGFSIHSQAASIIGKTDINTRLYILSKFLHGIFASIYTYFLYTPVLKGKITSTFIENYDSVDINVMHKWLLSFRFSLGMQLFTLFAIVGISILITLLEKMKSNLKSSFNKNF